jgi:hypothetical protein
MIAIITNAPQPQDIPTIVAVSSPVLYNYAQLLAAAADAYPAGQGVQYVLPVSLLNVFALHWLHELWPVWFAYVPIEHYWQLALSDRPVMGLNVPYEHNVQLEADLPPDVDKYVPAGQLIHYA